MKDELGPIAKLLVESARDGLSPDDAAIARVRGRVATAVATGAAATTAGAASAKAAGAVGAKAAAGIAGAKVAAIAVVASVAIGGGVVVATRSSGGEPAHVAPAEQHAVPAPVQQPAPAPTVEQPSPPPAPAASIPIPPPTPAKSRVAPPKLRAVEPAPDPAPEPIALPREVILIDDATTALRNGHPADAIATLAIYDREAAGQGQMAQDAAALELEALCALHAPEVPAKLAAFDRHWPKSAERTRIAAACGAK